MGASEQPRQGNNLARHLVFGSALIFLIWYAVVFQRPSILRVQPAGQVEHHDGNAPRLSTLASLESLEEAKNSEEIARILSITSDFLDALSSQYQIHSLLGLSSDLRAHASNARRSPLVSAASKALESRGLLDGLSGAAGAASGASGASGGAAMLSGLTSAFGNVASGALAESAQYLGDGIGRGATAGLNISNNAKTTAEPPTGLNAIADNLGFGISNGLAGSLDVSLIASPDTLAAASNALASGLGGGAAAGLGLNKTAIAAPTGTGVALVVGNLGSGLTSSFFKSASLSTFMTSLDVSKLNSAVISAGKGLGEGAARGLNKQVNEAKVDTSGLSIRDAANATDPVAFNAASAAEDFTQSVSSSFLASIDVKSLMALASSGAASMNLSSLIAPVLVAAGSGLGSGAASGLGAQPLAKSAMSATPDAPVVARNFAYQLTTSFFANGTLPALATKISTGSSGLPVMGNLLSSAAQGAGSGLGQGLAVGLGLQQADAQGNVTGGDAVIVARQFTFGLTSSFLANGTLTRLQSKGTSVLGNSSMSGMSLNSISFSKIAEGAARGLVDGAGSSIKMAGGMQAIMGKKSAANMPASNISANSSTFDDSVGGAASGFGFGLGAESVNLVLEALGQMNAAPAVTGAPGASKPGDNVSPLAIRSVSYAADGVITQQELSPSPSVDLSGVFAGLNITAADTVLQKGVNLLTCKGVGGATQILQGLRDSGALSGGTLPQGFLPNATFSVTNGGNLFNITTGDNMIISVNGVDQGRLVVLLAVHGKILISYLNPISADLPALVLIIAYFVAIPTALVLENGRTIAVLLMRPQYWVNAPKTKVMIWAFAVLPLALVGFIIGIVLLGSAKHFVTPHGVLGLVAIFVTLLAGLFELSLLPESLQFYTRLRATVLTILIALSTLSFVTGFIDIQRISLCTVQLPTAAIIVATMVSTSCLIASIAVVHARWVIQWWASNNDTTRSKVFGDKADRLPRNFIPVGAEEYAAPLNG
ncbi:hypothetical protein BP6252_05339 [Coleophoma cylindrospora]|uniref:Cytochrome b561 domain-containing protein n=1 Tax=Coleophoma cylindrospora TaxID=1849047 RepID=A0A3D8RTK8_9HELO|nr:hypothetical protein BP6252_05339 [Coleophoma cylindrospora]